MTLRETLSHCGIYFEKENKSSKDRIRLSNGNKNG